MCLKLTVSKWSYKVNWVASFGIGVLQRFEKNSHFCYLFTNKSWKEFNTKTSCPIKILRPYFGSQFCPGLTFSFGFVTPGCLETCYKFQVVIDLMLVLYHMIATCDSYVQWCVKFCMHAHQTKTISLPNPYHEHYL